jgi:diaminopimelate epimerase
MSSSKSLSFFKMHGLGNDFVIINNLDEQINFKNLNISQLANRHIGIGFDQLLLIEKSTTADFFCRIFNSDGSEASQCGNGLRCVARLLHEKNLHPSKEMVIQTISGLFPIRINDYANIKVQLGIPKIVSEPLKLNGYFFYIVDIGNPHAIVNAGSIPHANLIDIANEISSLSQFSNGVNVGLMQIENVSRIKLRTIERGAGETYACGSNACAAAATGIKYYGLANKLEVQLRHGFLTVEWQGENHPIYLTGPAEHVFAGSYFI